MQTNPVNSEYINADDALARIGGNTTLYKRLLGRFLDGNHYELIENAAKSGDSDETARQVHTLKGVSANLSLEKIHAITIEIEQLIKDGSELSSCLDELKQAFDATTQEIAKYNEQVS